MFKRAVYEASASALLEIIRRLPSAASTVLIVGHDPALPEVAAALAGDQPEVGSPHAELFDRMRAKFPTAAIAVLELSEPWAQLAAGCAHLASFVTPRDMIAERSANT